VDYHFLSLEEFQRMGDRGELLERACVYGQWYGVPRKEVNEALGRGEDVMVKVDIQGAKTLKGLFPEAVLIFLAPPTWEELVHRLRLRHTETESQFELRLKTVAEEMKAAPLFDYKVVNNKVEEAVECIKAIIIAEKCRLVRQSC
jgi:guanylate kinase